MSVIKDIFPLDFVWQTFDPFLFCVHHNDAYPKANGQFGPNASLAGRNIGQDFQNIDGWNMYHGAKVPGFPGHPHRGFETITVVNQGVVDHADSNGAAGRYGGGDTQWMTAGRGLQHSEMFPLLNENTDNPLVLFQIWINLAANNKMAEPGFDMLWREDIPVVESADQQGLKSTVQIVAGELNQQKPPKPPAASWANDEQNHVWVWNIKMDAHAQFEIPASAAGLNRVLYFYQGAEASLESHQLTLNHGARLQSDASIHIVAGDQPCEFLLLQGKPINEPVARYGPFVMNTEAEIQQAFADYRQTQFGGWPWPTHEPVHSDAKTRFAKFNENDVTVKPTL